MTVTTTTPPVILAIGGSDSAGMAGVQADLRVITALGGHGAAAITAVTAQHSGAVLGVNPVAAEVLHQQLEACRPLAPRAIKIGLLATVEQVRACADFVATLPDCPVVLDPVLDSSSGTALAAPGVAAALRELLLPRCTLATPNRDEAARLAAVELSHPEQVPALCATLAAGDTAILLKGGHWPGASCSDHFRGGDQRFWLASPRSHARHRRGTGCTLAAAAATALGLDYALADAVVIAKMAVNQGLRGGYGWGDHPGPLAVTGFPDDGRDLPRLADHSPPASEAPPFPPCGDMPLGLYPVVDRAAWLESLLPAGVSTIQLRIKDLTGESLRHEIARGIAVARRHGARLFINDHWRLAIEEGAYGVHLGQEDLALADIDAIRHAGLRLGISTHCHYEVARAIRHRPSYLACGPIYPTTSKDMPWSPHGPRGLAYWRRVLRGHTLVAIGGIDGERLPQVRAEGPDGIAMITALTRAADPPATARTFMAMMEGKGGTP